MEEINEIVKMVSEFNSLGKTLLLMELFKKEQIDFAEVAKMYVQILEQENKKKQHNISTLGLLLAVYCKDDKSSSGKNARKFLFESSQWSGDTSSPFGKQLSEEFKNQNHD